MSEPLRILVADDSADFREGIAALLASVDGLELVGEAVDGQQAVDGAFNLQPDVRPQLVQECIPLLEGWRRLADAAQVRSAGLEGS